jgi:hypothetical protein
MSDGDKHSVFVEEGGGSFRRQEVEVGDERRGSTRIERGLSQGQRVVVEGSLLLHSLVASRG